MARWYWPRLPVRLMTTSHMNGAMVRHELAEFRIQHELAFAAIRASFRRDKPHVDAVRSACPAGIRLKILTP
jgi:hypothetical protein